MIVKTYLQLNLHLAFRVISIVLFLLFNKCLNNQTIQTIQFNLSQKIILQLINYIKR